jgi:hypothetical protein
VTTRPPTDRELHILDIVADGDGDSDARRIDITMSQRFEGIDSTMLKELHALREAGYVTQELGRGGPGGRWAVTPAARPYLAAESG